MRILFGAFTAAAVLVGSHPDAAACEPPPPGAAAAGVVISVASGNALSMPKNLGLLFWVTAGEGTDQELGAQFSVTVKSAGGTALDGSVHRSKVAFGRGKNAWIWKPASGDLPVGGLEVALSAGSARVDPASPFTVTVEDREMTTPHFVPRVELSRTIAEDPNAPHAECHPTALSTCGTIFQPTSVSTRAVGLPTITAFLDWPGDLTGLVEWRGRMFGRFGQLEVTPAHAEIWEPTDIPVSFDRPVDEYCAEVTTQLFGADEPVIETVCVPHGTLDLSVSPAENDAFVANTLSRCVDPVFPATESSGPGTQALGAQGAGPPFTSQQSLDEGGCSTNGAKKRATDFGSIALLVAAGVVMRRRRRS